MTTEQKQQIAAAARRLINMLEACDDGDFVDLIIHCVASDDVWPLQVGNL